jgi:hypothetical protein
MERRVYILVSGLVGFAGFVLAMHLLRIENSIPPVVRLHGRNSYFAVSRDYYVRAMLLNAVLLPILCGLFGYVAHVGREIDVVSWIFVGGFYVAMWWLAWEADHAYQMNATDLSGIRVGYVSNPAYMLGVAIAAGLGFWKFKQDWAVESDS